MQLFRSFSRLIQNTILKFGSFPDFQLLKNIFTVSVMKEIHSCLVDCLIASVFMLLATDSKQKSKVKKISDIS